MHIFTRTLFLTFFLVYVFNFSYSQCGPAAGPGLSTIAFNLVVNSYYPGTGNPAIGATTLTVGARDTRGSANALSGGSMVLIIQMQGADLNTTNTNAYGDGVSGGTASGYLTTNLMAGKYEYNVVSAYNATTGVVTFLYPLANNYYTRTYGTTTGKQAYQLVRVPRYYDLTINPGRSIIAPAWNGSTGGVIVLEAANTVTIDGSVNANGLGFRGGGGRQLTGVSGGNTNGSGNITNTDFRWNSQATTAANGTGAAKGEGIAGTPRYTLDNSATTITIGTAEGYINGSTGRGAPANAGGGGTDGDPSQNRFNTGGGGGGNGGAGGKGGSGWDDGAGNAAAYATGGYGGAAFAQASLQQFVLGGGGGAGTCNNSTTTNQYLSSGGAGGGIIIIRARSYSGNGIVTANGAAANNITESDQTDAAGGGGAGGTVVLVTNQAGGNTSTPHSISIQAMGGRGGDMSAYYAHGPGGGGGGGYVITNVVPAGSISVTGGSNGFTRTGSTTAPVTNAYGSSSGANGRIVFLTGPVGFENPNNAGSPCGALPVTLRMWKGTYNNNKTWLNWQTDAGINFSHFVIEHSTNGTDFTALSHIDALPANGALTYSYSYVDANPANGVNYYRLKMVDDNGQYKYSGVITIRTIVKEFTVNASPNPFSDHVVVTISNNTDETVDLCMYNSEGKLAWRKTTFITAGTNALYFNNLQSLPKGMYYLKVNRINSTAEIKLIKQ
jgi:hypothetical protein